MLQPCRLWSWHIHWDVHNCECAQPGTCTGQPILAQCIGARPLGHEDQRCQRRRRPSVVSVCIPKKYSLRLFFVLAIDPAPPHDAFILEAHGNVAVLRRAHCLFGSPYYTQPYCQHITACWAGVDDSNTRPGCGRRILSFSALGDTPHFLTGHPIMLTLLTDFCTRGEQGGQVFSPPPTPASRVSPQSFNSPEAE